MQHCVTHDNPSAGWLFLFVIRTWIMKSSETATTKGSCYYLMITQFTARWHGGWQALVRRAHWGATFRGIVVLERDMTVLYVYCRREKEKKKKKARWKRWRKKWMGRKRESGFYDFVPHHRDPIPSFALGIHVSRAHQQPWEFGRNGILALWLTSANPVVPLFIKMHVPFLQDDTVSHPLLHYILTFLSWEGWMDDEELCVWQTSR